MKKLSLIIFVLGLSWAATAQPIIKFSTNTHDFGTIQEIDGKAKFVFEFTNDGNSELKLTDVKSSCGCTAPDWTKTPIPPKGKGFVSAEYNPMNRPGAFHKAVTVSTNDPKNPSVVLFIKGNVIAKPKTKVDLYPTPVGNLRFKTNHLAFMDITNKQTKTDSLPIFNNGTAAMEINTKNVPAWLKVTVKPSTLQPDEEGFIVITYDASKRNDYGLNFDRFILVTNDIKQAEKTINVSAKVVPDFSNLSPKKLKNSPTIEFNNTSYDFGIMKTGSKIEYKFEFKNAGKSDLVILKTKASCGCTAIQPESTKIKKGKSSYIAIVFNTAGRTGKQHKTVTVITNDPNNPEIILNISGELE
ncbi:MAG: DUF1573 domain-containing protein [Saprospiraceae bacterium]|nr:DUF1573 domain-containing protein [Saprospiraceae bacterium]